MSRITHCRVSDDMAGNPVYRLASDRQLVYVVLTPSGAYVEDFGHRKRHELGRFKTTPAALEAAEAWLGSGGFPEARRKNRAPATHPEETEIAVVHVPRIQRVVKETTRIRTTPEEDGRARRTTRMAAKSAPKATRTTAALKPAKAGTAAKSTPTPAKRTRPVAPESVPCPTCGQPARARCRRPSGGVTATHSARVAKAKRSA